MLTVVHHRYASNTTPLTKTDDQQCWVAAIPALHTVATFRHVSCPHPPPPSSHPTLTHNAHPPLICQSSLINSFPIFPCPLHQHVSNPTTPSLPPCPTARPSSKVTSSVLSKAPVHFLQHIHHTRLPAKPSHHNQEQYIHPCHVCRCVRLFLHWELMRTVSVVPGLTYRHLIFPHKR